MPLSPPSSSRRDLWPIVVSGAVALAYAGAHLAWYRTTPLGQVPVLDEQENLAFAEAIVRGALPPEPFYRAPGYALMLAALRALGVPVDSLFSAALTLGIGLHALNAALAARIARDLFGGAAAAFAAGVLYALHPVFVHYSTQALDATPALTLFLLGLACLPSSRGTPVAENTIRGAELWQWTGVSVAWAAATVTRPNFLLVWCTLPLLALGSRARRWPCVATAFSGAILFGFVAAWQWRVCGEAGFLPWQGTYNLWAANQPGAHGRYYVQREKLPPGLADQNPARAESIYLFRQETGHAPADVRELNAHWRAQFVAQITSHPFAWVGLLGRKTYALLNNWEQYNNKTFAFHKARSPWLSWNPLCWGVLLALAVAGAARLSTESPKRALLLAVIAAALAIGVVLFFVSARFRLPLAALATILASGAVAAPRFWRLWPRTRRLALATAVAAAIAIAFSRFDRVAEPGTFVEDHALLARAAATIGDDDTTWTEAAAALALQPQHPDALRLAIAAYFNELVLRHANPARERLWTDLCVHFLESGANDVDGMRAVAAVALWRVQRQADALAEWRALGRSPSAIAARLLAGDLRVSPRDLEDAPEAAHGQALFQLAMARFAGNSPDIAAASEVARKIFGMDIAPGKTP